MQPWSSQLHIVACTFMKRSAVNSILILGAMLQGAATQVFFMSRKNTMLMSYAPFIILNQRGFKIRSILYALQNKSEWSTSFINAYKMQQDDSRHNTTQVIMYKQSYNIVGIRIATMFNTVVSCFDTSLKIEEPFQVNMMRLCLHEKCDFLYTTTIWIDWILLWLILLY